MHTLLLYLGGVLDRLHRKKIILWNLYFQFGSFFWTSVYIGGHFEIYNNTGVSGMMCNSALMLSCHMVDNITSLQVTFYWHQSWLALVLNLIISNAGQAIARNDNFKDWFFQSTNLQPPNLQAQHTFNNTGLRDFPTYTSL